MYLLGCGILKELDYNAYAYITEFGFSYWANKIVTLANGKVKKIQFIKTMGKSKLEFEWMEL